MLISETWLTDRDATNRRRTIKSIYRYKQKYRRTGNKGKNLTQKKDKMDFSVSSSLLDIKRFPDRITFVVVGGMEAKTSLMRQFFFVGRQS